MNQTIEKHPLQYYMHDGSSAFRFELAGDLTDEGARRLEHDWRSASSVVGHRALIVDTTFLTGADDEGRALLMRWYANGARIIAKSKTSREMAEAILGEPLPELATAPSSYQTWQPFRSVAAPAFHLILLIGALLFPVSVRAAADGLTSAGHVAVAPASLVSDAPMFAAVR